MDALEEEDSEVQERVPSNLGTLVAGVHKHEDDHKRPDNPSPAHRRQDMVAAVVHLPFPPLRLAVVRRDAR